MSLLIQPGSTLRYTDLEVRNAGDDGVVAYGNASFFGFGLSVHNCVNDGLVVSNAYCQIGEDVNNPVTHQFSDNGGEGIKNNGGEIVCIEDISVTGNGGYGMAARHGGYNRIDNPMVYAGNGVGNAVLPDGTAAIVDPITGVPVAGYDGSLNEYTII